MKSALDIRIFKEFLAGRCVEEVSEMPKHLLQGTQITAGHLTRRSYQSGQSQGLIWIENLEVMEPIKLEELIRNKLKLEKKFLLRQVKVDSQIDEKVSGVCNSVIGLVIDFIFSTYIVLENRVAEERIETENMGPCASLRDVTTLGVISALHWMLDEV